MIGFGEDLTKENIFKKISSYDIFKKYSDKFEQVNLHFHSDFREEDNPSCCVAQIGGDLLYTDFGTGKSYRSINFVMEKLGLNYFEALEVINSDFNLGLGVYHKGMPLPVSSSPNKAVRTNKTFKEKQPSILKKKKRSFTAKDLEYWAQYYWDLDMLEKSNTQSISHYWINGSMWTVKPDELAYSYEYYWHNGRMQRKLYFPERDKFKWFSNVDSTIVQLVNVSPKKGEILFITSSKKDAGIFWRIQRDGLLPGYVIHGVAPNTENSFVPEAWFNKAKKRWDKIVLWYNNDEPGIENSKIFGELYDLPVFYNPLGTPKDPSDFCKKYGIEEFVKLVKKIVDDIYQIVS